MRTAPRTNFALARSRQSLCAMAMLVGFAVDSASAAEKPDFNFDVRPLLSDRCFKCHGPDEKSRKAKLRLDFPDGVFKKLGDGMQVVAPGKPEQSELVRRITAKDPDDLMPPPESNLALTTNEISTLRRWVEQGAEYKKHWAFIPVGDIPVPPVKDDTRRGRNPVDAFVLQKLQRENLKPSSEATKETLIRRVTLDLIGLPPTVADIDNFLNDSSPNAYEKVVDRLLASLAYGERMAVDWLDLARYADTYGYQADVDRDMSAWRDWVVRALNENLPYDQFLLWQLAGDLLPDATRDQILATAFNRLHRQTNEGGSIEEEFRTEYVADRVNTIGTAMLGLTVECSRCHDHKYDPITQKDYYRMFAFFNSVDESGLYSHFTQAVPTPTLLLYGDGVEAKQRELKKEIANKEAALAKMEGEAQTRFGEWEKSGKVESPQPIASFAFDEVVSNKTANAVNTNFARLIDSPELVEGYNGKAIKFSGDNSVVCKGAGLFTRVDPFSFSLWLRPGELQSRAVIFHRSRAWTDSASRGYELLLEDGRPNFALIHFWPGNAMRVIAKDALPTNAWSHLTITYEGSSRAAGLKLYLNGALLETEVVRDNLFKDIVHRKEWGDMEVDKIDLTLGARFRDAGFKNGSVDDFEIFDRCLSTLEVQLLAERGSVTRSSVERDEALRLPESRSMKEDRKVFAYYLANHDAEHRAALAELKQLRTEENQLVNDVREIMVMKELPQPRPAFVLKRGAYDAPGERVERGTPDGIFPFPKEYPRNRLGFAKWMVDRRNPLTARVAVNRIWKMHFGRGLVATLNDFGSQGQLPTHPELLEFLANHFMTSGWNRKAMHKLIVTSATYRQSSQADREFISRDPENRLLARGPKHRLEAEQIRDSALAVSGLLSPQIGGRSVKPYQPAGLWEESGTGKSYTQDKGEKLYRRSLYTFWRRTAPPPSMTTFDATSREVCTAKRDATSTPLQALVLLNDPQYVEASRVFAEWLLRETTNTIEVRIASAFRAVAGRHAERRETEILRRLYDEQFEYFSVNAEAAEKYLRTGEWPRDKSLSAPEVAATAVLLNTLLNHDAFVMKR